MLGHIILDKINLLVMSCVLNNKTCHGKNIIELDVKTALECLHTAGQYILLILKTVQDQM